MEDSTAFGDGKLRPFADSIWTAATPIRFAGAWFPHVMTVVRLSTGDLLLHSPCRPLSDLMRDIALTGSVAHIVAPNWFHDLYLDEYRALFPEATFWGPSFLQRQHRKVIDCPLDGAARPPWFDDMPHVTLSGRLTFDESIFFHKPTQTLIVADLLTNASADVRMPLATRLGYRFFGLNGNLRVFPIIRWFSISSRASLQRVAQQIFHWDPAQLIVAHGKPIRENVDVDLQSAFRWLKVPPEVQLRR
ncbi:MAG TPA: DUF4336 domain-containing protein [Candidatus Baltobacteraceae bacterium]|nr:DUF4336 domain-containing protein [Candidatus Baltobacteraceae bacterium]